MWQFTVESVRITGGQGLNLFANRHFKSTAQYDSAFLGFVTQHRLAGVGAGTVSLVQYL